MKDLADIFEKGPFFPQFPDFFLTESPFGAIVGWNGQKTDTKQNVSK